MKRVFCYCLAFLAVLALTPYAFADTVSGTTGSFQSWTLADLNQNGVPYWDNTSSDGSQKNVGYYLSNTGFFSGSTAGPGVIPFWGTAAGAADSGFSFTKTSPSDQAALRIEIAGNANINEFGWYDTANPSTLHTIFNGPATAGATGTFSPSAQYGFYFSTADGIFNTQTAGNSAYAGEQHFALYEATDGYWLGMEDLAFNHSDKDYNDMIVKVSPVPEPASLLLLGLGLIGGAGVRRKFSE